MDPPADRALTDARDVSGAPTGARPAERLVARALGRAAVYRLLGSAFVEPTPERLAEVAAAADSAARSPDHGPEIRAALAALASAARETDPDALAAEHVFLFDRQVRCPPWEGAWGDGPQVAGKAAMLADVAGFYRAFGLEARAGQTATEDHIAAELEFMSALAVKEAWALAEGRHDAEEVTRRAATAFLRDHLGRWAETFARELAAATPLPYYTAAASLLAAWVRQEGTALGAVAVPVTGRLGPDPAQGDTFACPMAEPGPEA